VVLQAPAPARLIEGGVPTEATVAHVLVSRYADHLPLYRQSQILARQGIEIGREVLADWTGTGALEIVPLVRRMREILLASPRLFADETTMPVLDPGPRQDEEGLCLGRSRGTTGPGVGADPPAVVFHYAPRRAAPSTPRICWRAIAGSCSATATAPTSAGVLQCDGYGAYKTLAATSEGITLAFCSSHVRRQFIELAKGKTAPIAAETLQRIAALYAGRGGRCAANLPTSATPSATRGAAPLVEDLFLWLTAQLARLPGSGPTAEAIRYALNHREGLARFLEDGMIELDTNTAERAIRPICLSRKNALFASGDDGGARWAAGGLARRDLQAEQRRPAALPRRRADAPRQRLAQQRHRRTHAPWRWAADENGTASSEGHEGP
jgi:transposase